jgi:hypothetical protein
MTLRHLLKSLDTLYEDRLLLRLRIGLLCSCLMIMKLAAQDQPPPTPPPQPPAPIEPTPVIPKPVVQLPPPQPPAPPSTYDYDTGGDNWSIAPFDWITKSAPIIRQGHANTDIDPGDLGFPGRSKEGYGFEITVPTGHENSVDFRYFQAKGQGNSVLGESEAFFGTLYAVGDVLASNWYAQSIKLSWNYLTYPYPSNHEKFRLKTLWELQYDRVGSSFNAPADVNAAPVVGVKSIIFPTFGIGIEYHPAKHLRLELKASGFAVPHHGDIYDGEANIVIPGRHFEVALGGKVYHYKTSPQADQYLAQTLFGPYLELRLKTR